MTRKAISMVAVLFFLGGCARAVTDNGPTGDAGSTQGGAGSGAGGSGATAGMAGVAGTGGTQAGSGGSGVPECAAGQSEPCYDGSEGTKGVGACKPGVRTCEADGSGFGPCMGQVMPVAESCATPVDEDCDGQVNNGCTCSPGQSQSCYSGPQGSMGVGVCKAGTQSCLPDGSGYGQCIGEVLPLAENCGTFQDDDCDGQVNEAEAGCNPAECAGCVVSQAPSCASTAVVVGHYAGGSRTVCVAKGDGSKFDLALLSYESSSWTLIGDTSRITKIQVYSFDPPATIQGNGAIPTSIQINGDFPADPYDYSMSLGDCPAHTGYAGAVFGVPQANVCHMEQGLDGACSYPDYACLAISP